MKINNVILTVISMVGFSFATSYTITGISVGSVRVDTRNGGFYNFEKSDKTKFDASCLDIEMWPNDLTNYYQATIEGKKTVLSVLLTAKSTGNKVTIQYNRDDNNCRLEQITIE